MHEGADAKAAAAAGAPGTLQEYIGAVCRAAAAKRRLELVVGVEGAAGAVGVAAAEGVAALHAAQ